LYNLKVKNIVYIINSEDISKLDNSIFL